MASVLLRDGPQRAIALATPSHVLLFRHSGSQQSGNTSSTSLPGQVTGQGSQTGGSKCIVELVTAEKADVNAYRVLSRSIHGCLGLITINLDVFLCVVSGATKAATLRPGEAVQKILSVDFYCLNRPDFDHLMNDELNLYAAENLDEDGYDMGQGHSRRDQALEHPCLALKKLLSGGSFYYSVDFNLTSRLQDRASQGDFDFDAFDRGYLWNGYMIKPLIDFRSRLSDQERKVLDSTRLLTAAIRGFASTMTVPAPASPARRSRTGLPSTLTLVSRLSCARAGTRFNARGIDDDGNVANFVETETIFWSPEGVCFSYVQIRGSVPIFWEQSAGLLPGQQRVQLTRSPQATQPAFDKHFEQLELKYGPIHIVNLLSKEKAGEIEISQRYSSHVTRSSLNCRSDRDSGSEHGLLRETQYDFHAETRAGGYEAASGISRYIQGSADSFGYCLIEGVDSETEKQSLGSSGQIRPSTIILQQDGVFRTNCLDCLDRTNLMQTIISRIAIESFLEPRGEHATGDFLARHGSLWADNGDALSKIYAGTGALKSSFTRSGKMSIAGALADARKSATRMYINNFADKGRQNVMDMLLGRLLGQNPVYLFDPINDYVTAELSRRASEYSSLRDITISAHTFNLNGRRDGLQEDLSVWICPNVDKSHQSLDIVAVGFQEIVQLNPQHIMSTDPTVRQQWEKAVKKTLNNNAKARGSEEYVLLRGGQLVGASLSLFAKVSLLARIKNVEGSLKKTGMSGMAGNKGAVAIRLDVDNTSLCFVTAHLAAGFANYEERNRDYHTISQGLRFQRNRSIHDHDTVIWLGDFNYRIGLSYDKALSYAKREDYEQLYENDQLNLQMVAGLTFPHYSEARILFRPTYKFDLGTDDYDTSEKNRIPAWTDRILRKGTNIRQFHYDSAPLRFSDHRPVYATFTCTVNVVDENRKNAISKEMYSQRRAALGTLSSPRSISGDSDDEDLLGYESVAPGLPPASSAQGSKWWIDGTLPARSTLQPPGKGYAPNPSRPANPFTPSDQPDWVMVPNRSPGQIPARKAVMPSSSPSQAPRPLPIRTTEPPLRSTSGTSITSDGSSSTVIRRPSAPPAVPRKPASLSSNPASPAAEKEPPLPPPPRRSNVKQTKSLLDDDEEGEIVPVLPRRKDGLDDEGVGNPLSGWVALKPS